MQAPRRTPTENELWTAELDAAVAAFHLRQLELRYGVGRCKVRGRAALKLRQQAQVVADWQARVAILRTGGTTQTQGTERRVPETADVAPMPETSDGRGRVISKDRTLDGARLKRLGADFRRRP